MDRPQSPDSARTSLAKTRGLRTHFFNFEKGTDREKGGADLGPGKFGEIPGANLKQVAVASKWVSRNDSGCDFIVSGQMETLTKTIRISDRAISPVGLRKVRPFPEAVQVGARNATKYFPGKLRSFAKTGLRNPGNK